MSGAVQSVQQWAKLKYGVRVPIMVIPHTFGGGLNFNSHLHILVSVGGLLESEGRWVNSLVFDEDEDKGKLMRMWRFAVITYLRAAVKAKVLASDLSPRELRIRLKKQYERWWSIDIDHFASKKHFLRYAGRYVRRPPIAQHRFVKRAERVQFLARTEMDSRNFINYVAQEITIDHAVDRAFENRRDYIAPVASISSGETPQVGKQPRPT